MAGDMLRWWQCTQCKEMSQSCLLLILSRSCLLIQVLSALLKWCHSALVSMIFGSPQSCPCWWVMVQEDTQRGHDRPKPQASIWKEGLVHWAAVSKLSASSLQTSALNMSLLLPAHLYLSAVWPGCELSHAGCLPSEGQAAHLALRYLSHTLIGLLSVYWSKQVAAHLPRSPGAAAGMCRGTQRSFYNFHFPGSWSRRQPVFK